MQARPVELVAVVALQALVAAKVMGMPETEVLVVPVAPAAQAVAVQVETEVILMVSSCGLMPQ